MRSDTADAKISLSDAPMWEIIKKKLQNTKLYCTKTSHCTVKMLQKIKNNFIDSSTKKFRVIVKQTEIHNHF